MKSSRFYRGQTIAEYRLDNLIGMGESVEVWSAIFQDNSVVAFKIYEKTAELKLIAEHEYQTASIFKNPNILKPIGKLEYEGHSIIVFPYCEGRSVDCVAGHVSVRMIWRLIHDICSALDCIHSAGYIHHNVNPSNILWDGKLFLLTGFSLCSPSHSCMDDKHSICRNSHRFTAPEVLPDASSMTDVWSLGATIFHLYMGSFVFNGLGGRAQHYGSPLPYMRKSLPALSNLVQQCLSFNPDDRPTAHEIYGLARMELDKVLSVNEGRKLKKSIIPYSNERKADFWSDEMIEI